MAAGGGERTSGGQGRPESKGANKRQTTLRENFLVKNIQQNVKLTGVLQYQLVKYIIHSVKNQRKFGEMQINMWKYESSNDEMGIKGLTILLAVKAH